MNACSRFLRIRFLAVAALLLVAIPLLAEAQHFPSPGGGQDGVLRLAGPVDLQTLDPAKAKDLGTLFLVRQIFSGLTRLDDDLQPVPALADTDRRFGRWADLYLYAAQERAFPGWK